MLEQMCGQHMKQRNTGNIMNLIIYSPGDIPSQSIYNSQGHISNEVLNPVKMNTNCILLIH
jgi:hypothetical protein